MMKPFSILGLILLVIIVGYVFVADRGEPLVEVPEEVTEPNQVETQPDTTSETSSEEPEPAIVVESEVDASLDVPQELESVERVFTLDSFSYGYSENELRVNEGDTVTINLTNSQGFHDWVVDEFGAATAKIQAGDTTSVTFVADKAGTYEYYCSVGNHRAQGMVGTLIVE